MNALLVIIIIGVALIDGKLWKMMGAQSRHQKRVEDLLQQILDRQGER